MDFSAATMQARHTFGCDRRDHLVSVPPRCEQLRADMEIEAIPGVLDAERLWRHPQRWNGGQCVAHRRCVLPSSRNPQVHLAQLAATDGSLNLAHSGVSPETLMQPPEPRRMLTVKDRGEALAMVLGLPYPPPQALVSGSHRTALARGRHD